MRRGYQAMATLSRCSTRKTVLNPTSRSTWLASAAARAAVAALLGMVAVAPVPAQEPPSQKSLNAQLIEFAKKGDEARVLKALEQGASPNTRNRTGQTALYLFAQKGNLNAVKALLDKGADVNLETLDKTTPLMAAANSGHLDIVALLVEIDVMNYLLDKGVDVNQRYKHDTTLIMWAAGYGQVDAVKALVARGADPALIDDRGKTALDVARGQRLAEVAAYLETVTPEK
jgi:uncharacterized protein